MGAFVAKGHTVSGKGPQVKAAVRRSAQRNGANVRKAAQTRITAPSHKVAKGY